MYESEVSLAQLLMIPLHDHSLESVKIKLR